MDSKEPEDGINPGTAAFLEGEGPSQVTTTASRVCGSGQGTAARPQTHREMTSARNFWTTTGGRKRIQGPRRLPPCRPQMTPASVLQKYSQLYPNMMAWTTWPMGPEAGRGLKPWVQAKMDLSLSLFLFRDKVYYVTQGGSDS